MDLAAEVAMPNARNTGKNSKSRPFQAVLLLGPTGVGKTPLGRWLEQHGFRGSPCHHFDFGANLRTVLSSGSACQFTRDEIQFLQRVVTQGALLENEAFCLAEKILHDFLVQRGVQSGHWLVLNGLPRHVGQAERLEPRVRVKVVVRLKCDACTIHERLRLDSGGDRMGRLDDDEALVARKLAIYEERTVPLIEHYRWREARLLEVKVQATTQPQDIAAFLEEV